MASSMGEPRGTNGRRRPSALPPPPAVSRSHAEKRPAVFLVVSAADIVVVLFSASEGGWAFPLKSTRAQRGLAAEWAIAEPVQQPVAAR